MTNKELLRENAIVALGESELEQLSEWYKAIISHRLSYTVFVNSRTYLLAQVLEELTDIKMEHRRALYLTDTAFSLRYNELAEYYKEHGMFPSIALVIDLIYNGIELNRIIDNTVDAICDILEKHSENDRRDIDAALMDAMRIYTISSVKGNLILIEKYKRKLIYDRKVNNSEWNELNSNLQLLILYSNIVNSKYTITKNITEEEFSDIEQSLIDCGFIKTLYQDATHYTQTKIISDNKIKAIYGIKIIQNNLWESYKIVPFILLSSLNSDEVNNIINKVTNKLTNIQTKNWISNIYSTHNTKCITELLLLLFSNTVLNDFVTSFNIAKLTDTQEYSTEINRLSRNFCYSDVEDTRNNIKELLNYEIFNIKELIEVFVNCSSTLTNKGIITNKSVNIQDIFTSQENKLYKLAHKVAESAVKFATMVYVTDTARVDKTAFKSTDEFIDTDISVEYIASLMQMMDAGYIDLVALENSEMTFKLYIKCNIQGIFVIIRRLAEYTGLASMIGRKCSQWDLQYEQAIDNYAASEYCDLNKDTIDKLKYLFKSLKEIKQRPEDWKGNYQLRILTQDKFSIESLNELRDFQRKADKHTRNYAEYLKVNRY